MKDLNKLLVTVCTFFVFVSGAVAKDTPVIPDLLKPWTDWVLHGYEEQLYCSPAYNDADNIQCDWPSVLDFTLSEKTGKFNQQWLIQHERWVQLPGNLDIWPHDVAVDGNDSPVLNVNGQPKIKLSAGKHTVTGSFSWATIPEYMSVPVHTGIVSLTLNGKSIDFPNLDANGRLWLQAGKQAEEKIENRLQVQSFRYIDDQIPVNMIISVNINVSGTAREVLIGPVVSPEAFMPLEVRSSLPVRLEPDGRVRIQVRPGQWTLSLTYRHEGPLDNLEFIHPEDGFWPKEEIWVFNSHPNLRVVEIEGVPPIDPLQTSLPEQWRRLPAYRVLAGDTMKLKEMKRGDPYPAPDQLTLQRNIWLRFDGSGYTIQDAIEGTKTDDWRLEMNEQIQLGRVAVDGKEQFITRMGDNGKTGVELRKGNLNLTADSIYREDIARLPATGWDHDFQQVSAKLHIPPGWRLLNASGVDTIRGTWMQRWTLLDFFIVLIVTFAVAKLYSKPMAGLAFATLVLVYHEPNAPRWIWLAILTGVALLKYLPEGKFKSVVKGYQIVNILLLIVLVIPFSIEQLRTGIYPQLEKPWLSMISLPTSQAVVPEIIEDAGAVRQKAMEGEMQPDVLMEQIPQERLRLSRGYKGKDGWSSSSQVDKVAQYDPAMINQTGPGLPSWQWNIFPMSWSGPVQKDQEISFLLVGPKTNLVLSFLRVILFIFLILGLFGIRWLKGKGISTQNLKSMFGVLLLAILVGPGLVKNVQAGEIPSPQMFEELRNRLLEKEECFPGCADISSMQVTISPENLHITLQAVSNIDASIPLPGNARHWLPQEVWLDNKPLEGLFRVDDTLWTLVPAGEHTITLVGRLPRQNSVDLPLSLKPHRVVSYADGWTVEGIHENGIADNQIQFKRVMEEDDKTKGILETGVLPPFLQIERTLRLGLDWTVETTIRRLNPSGAAAVFNFTLLPGESVVTEDIRVKDNQAQITMNARQAALRFNSVIAKTGELKLVHTATDLWTEIWRVDVSPIFHMETSGIPVILHQQGNRWYPTWHPWPGDEVKLTITRPQGVEGKTITVDRTHLEVSPGQRATDATMRLSIRSSQGTQHTVEIPEKAELLEVAINDRVQPIRQEGRRVTLPIKPGKQEVILKWREPTGISAFFRTPSVNLGIDSVNDNIDIHLPYNRWPLLMGGPLMGPAALFWSVVLILLLVAYGLSRTGLTPLKFHHWFLLGIGMSQSNLIGCMIVAGWLIALDLRQRAKEDMDKTTFNLMQVGIAVLTLLAFGSLVIAINRGLLGHPDMNIVGNGSHSGLLRWYEDYSGKVYPVAWLFSLPMFVYRLAMLAWALWLSFYLIRLLKWGWGNFSEPLIWHKIPRKKRESKSKKREETPEKV